MLLLEPVALSATRYSQGLIRCSAFICRERLSTYKKDWNKCKEELWSSCF